MRVFEAITATCRAVLPSKSFALGFVRLWARITEATISLPEKEAQCRGVPLLVSQTSKERPCAWRYRRIKAWSP